MNIAEYDRIQNMLSFERELWEKDIRYVAGLDEAGRGPLAGPVVAAAVIFSKNAYIPMIDDSKRLSVEVREFLYDVILQEALDFGIGMAEVSEIDEINIYQASFLAMKRALDTLKIEPEFLLVDGRAFPHDSIPFTAIVKGDSQCFSIASASIIAKVTRDKIMYEYDTKFPHYGFARHKGYPTRAHLDAIEKYGFCKIHRQSFHPKRFLENAFDKEKNAEKGS